MLLFCLPSSLADAGVLQPEVDPAAPPAHVHTLREKLAQRCRNSSAVLDDCRSQELRGSLRRLMSLKPLDNDLDKALAASLNHHRRTHFVQEFNSSALNMAAPWANFGTTGYSAAIQPEQQCRCNVTMWGQASDLIFTPGSDGARGDKWECPGAKDGTFLGLKSQMESEYGLGQMMPSRPYCSEGDGSMAFQPGKDLCNPCRVAEKPNELQAVWSSRVHINKDGLGQNCKGQNWPTTKDFRVLVAVQYRNTEWVWLEVPENATLGNTVTQVQTGSTASGDRSEFYRTNIKTGLFPETWLMGSTSFDVPPDTPMRVMAGIRYPDCNLYALGTYTRAADGITGVWNPPGAGAGADFFPGKVAGEGAASASGGNAATAVAAVAAPRKKEDTMAVARQQQQQEQAAEQPAAPQQPAATPAAAAETTAEAASTVPEPGGQPKTREALEKENAELRAALRQRQATDTEADARAASASAAAAGVNFAGVAGDADADAARQAAVSTTDNEYVRATAYMFM